MLHVVHDTIEVLQLNPKKDEARKRVEKDSALETIPEETLAVRTRHLQKQRPEHA